MLRCPKCSRVYQDGTQRFCTIDGVRLQSDDEAVRQLERIPTGQLPRLTAPGELLNETVIMPPNDFTQTLPAKDDSAALKTVRPFVVPANNGAKAQGEDLGTSDYSFFKAPATEEPPPDDKADLAQEAVFEFKTESQRVARRRPAASPPATQQKRRLSRVFVAASLATVLLIVGGIGLAAFYLQKNQTIAFFGKTDAQINAPTQPVEPPKNELTVKNEETAKNIPTIPEKSFLRGNLINFNNARENLDGKLAEKYVGFSLSYPNDWEKNPNEGVKGASNFIDLANRVSTGIPLEQLLISYYESKGTFEADRETFPLLAKKLAGMYKGIPDYKQVSEGAVKINDYHAYQVRFQSEALDKNGERVKIWGRTIFLPINKREARSGLLITLLATSLAPALEKVEDVGEKGELAQILQSIRLAE